MSLDPKNEALQLFSPLLSKALPYLRGEHPAWDEWAAESLKADYPDTTTNIFGKAKGFLECLESFTDLRVNADTETIYDPRWKKARLRADISAIAMVIAHGNAKNTITAMTHLIDDLDRVFNQPPG